MGTYQIGVLEGDGIGPEIMEETIHVLEEVQTQTSNLALHFKYLPIGLQAYHRQGVTLPRETIDSLKAMDAGILGPLSTHAYDISNSNMVNPSGFLRKELDLYANVRPAKTYHGVPSLFSGIDLIVVRENTEGMYADRNLYDRSGEFMPDPDTVLSLRLITRKASKRLAKIGIELAAARKKHLTIIHKMNVLRKGCGLFYESCQKIGEHYPDIFIDDYHVDAFAMHLVQHPQDYDVIVTTNMFGDILSAQTAGLIGGLGLAPGLNAGDSFLLAQATHGSAPDIAGKNIANPVSEILSAKMMLEWLGIRHQDPQALQAAYAMEKAVEKALADGNGTKDIGGNLSTKSFGQYITQSLNFLE
ncbi:isocitrate/isopropylmalate dehydrogenase family protein [Salibacterium aidingense]|uniref:isocitrate/isopropylmalate dehydrogenase family protein n=1 Tax=Salibacterium aidingense TaxID=384933 RepID=UPI003BC39104